MEIKWSENIREEQIKIHLRETDCEDVRWTELVQYRFQWRTLVSTVLIRRALLADCYSCSCEI